MALKISKGKILVDITPEELLQYFGINMVQMLNATISATQEFTGDWGNSTLYLSDVKGNEEQILDAILYEIKKDALESINCEGPYSDMNIPIKEDFYRIVIDNVPVFVYEIKDEAIDDAYSIHKNGESDVRVEDSKGNILWDSTYINPGDVSQVKRRIYEKRKNQNCDD